jgi:aldehyde dehydrogenase (NAD+)
MVKPPEQTYHTSKLIEEMLSNHFDKEFLAVVQGEGHVVVPQMMNSHRFDHVFFTGSVPVGRKIAEMAASKLVPTTLELGGKSPAVVDGTANLKVAARRIAFGKWLNAGQTCVAPDYLLVHKSNYEHFIEELQKVIREFYGSKPLESKDYTRIVNKDRYQALKQYLQYGKLRFGGSYNDERLMIEPTLITDVPMDSPLMQEEIFGPILPILSYEKPREALDLIQQNPNPLAFYIFTKDKAIEDTFVNELSFGGGAINNTVVHLTNPELPFGGIGNSGIGNYHGRYGFDAFSHFKSIMKSGTWFDLKRKYPPYSQAAYRMIKWLMK